MELTIDLRRDEVSDLQKALTLISEALAERTGQKPAQSATQSAPAPQSAQPTSTGLFAPRSSQAGPSQSSSFLPTNPRPVEARQAESRASSVSNQESFNMLNLLAGKKK